MDRAVVHRVVDSAVRGADRLRGVAVHIVRHVELVAGVAPVAALLFGLVFACFDDPLLSSPISLFAVYPCCRWKFAIKVATLARLLRSVGLKKPSPVPLMIPARCSAVTAGLAQLAIKC